MCCEEGKFRFREKCGCEEGERGHARYEKQATRRERKSVGGGGGDDDAGVSNPFRGGSSQSQLNEGDGALAGAPQRCPRLFKGRTFVYSTNETRTRGVKESAKKKSFLFEKKEMGGVDLNGVGLGSVSLFSAVVASKGKGSRKSGLCAYPADGRRRTASRFSKQK